MGVTGAAPGNATTLPATLSISVGSPESSAVAIEVRRGCGIRCIAGAWRQSAEQQGDSGAQQGDAGAKQGQSQDVPTQYRNYFVHETHPPLWEIETSVITFLFEKRQRIGVIPRNLKTR